MGRRRREAIAERAEGGPEATQAAGHKVATKSAYMVASCRFLSICRFDRMSPAILAWGFGTFAAISSLRQHRHTALRFSTRPLPPLTRRLPARFDPPPAGRLDR